MTQIYLDGQGGTAWARTEGHLTAGMVGVPVEITTDSAWDGLVKTLVCRGGNRQIPVVLGPETPAAAWETLVEGTHLYLGLEGRNEAGDLILPTTWADCGLVHPGAAGSHQTAAPTPNEVEQMLTLTAQACEYGKQALELGQKLEEFTSPTQQNTVYCWGDSLTQGIGGNVNGWHLMSYPQMLSQRVKTVNLGIMSDDVPTIQARQGSDPVVLPGFTLPASAGQKVAIGGVDDGLPTRSGKIAKLLRYGDAGLNPCYVGGIKCYLSRDFKSDTAAGTTFYIRRAEDGEAVDIPAGTELETFAARHYRGNGIHIFWMGANGGYGTSEKGLEFAGYLTRLKQCVDFAGVQTYFIVYARERRGYAVDEAGEIRQLIDTFGSRHVILLLPALAERGLLYAETNLWDGELVNGVPRVLDSGDGCHYSFYGYQAIAGVIWEHVAPYVFQNTHAAELLPDEPTGDEIGQWAYKLRKPKVLTASDSGIITTFQPFRTARQQWTVTVKYKADIRSAAAGDSAALMWAEAKHEDALIRASAYIEAGYTCTEPMCLLGSGGFRIDPTGFTLSEDGCHYLTVVRSAGQWGAWLDGNWMYGSWLNYDIGDATGQESLVIGAMTNGAWKAVGEIADVRIYDQALDDAAVKRLYQLMKEGEQA